MKRKFLSIFLALAMCLSLMPTVALAEEGDIPYKSWNSNTLVDATCSASDYTEVTSTTGAASSSGDVTEYTWDEGWYVVKEDVTIDGKVVIMSGKAVHLILCDDATLTVNGGIKGDSDAKLHIYGQSEGTGELVVGGDAGGTTMAAAIYISGTSSLIEINGGKVTAELNSSPKNIRCVYVSGKMTVNGGEVKVIGGNTTLNNNETTANLGSGIYVSKDMTINGGKVAVTSGELYYTTNETGNAVGCASIGLRVNGLLTVNGGEVKAVGGDVTDIDHNHTNSTRVESYGIFVKNDITVTDGTVNAASGSVLVIGQDGATSSSNNIISCSSGIFLEKPSGDTTYELKVSGGKVMAAGKNATGGDPASYDINWNGNINISGGAIQKNVSGDAVKVLIGKKLIADGGTIRLAENSRIYDSISVNGENKFNTLLAEGCGYFKCDGDINNLTKVVKGNILTNDITFIISANSGDDKYIIIKENNESIPYLDENGAKKSCVFYTELTSGTSLSSGWYVVKDDVNFSDCLNVLGEVHLILCDNKTLTLPNSVSCGNGAKLYIYAQSVADTATTQVGKINVTGESSVDSDSKMYAAIAMNDGTLVINGGKISATADKEDKENAGIFVRYLTVNGGEVTAKGSNSGTNMKNEAYGIIVSNGSSSRMEVNGGKVTAIGGTAATGSHGIEISGELTVNGGEVNATGGDTKSSYGIYAVTGPLKVSGGEVKATSGSAENSYGIFMQNPCNTTVTGGILIAKGGTVTRSVADDDYNRYGSYGIYMISGGNFAVSDEGKVTAEANTANFTEPIVEGLSMGIYVLENSSCCITVKDDGELIATGNTISSKIFSYSGGIYGKNLTVNVQNDGKLTADGGNASGNYVTDSYGISCHTINVAGEGAEVKATSGNVILTDVLSTISPSCNSYGILTTNGMTVSDGTVTAKRGTVTWEDNEGKSYDINGIMTVSGGTVQSATGGAAVLVCADSNGNSVNVSGGAMKLAENSVMKQINVNGNATLLNLVNEDYGYKNISDDTFATAVGVNTLRDVIVKLCDTHSAQYGTCDYCGKYLGPAGSSSSTGSSSSSYTVTPEESVNGSITVSPQRATAGDTVTITVTPDSGYALETLTVLDQNGNEIQLTAKDDGTYTFTMPRGKVEIKSTFAKENSTQNFFTDVSAGKYYYDAVLWAIKNGITSGIDDNHFGADLSCTRTQLVTFLWRAAGCPMSSHVMEFTDVDENAYYGEALRWAASLGIVEGYGNGLFGAGNSITRQQMAVILYRFAQVMEMDITQGNIDVQDFADYESISDYAVEAMQWAVKTGIIQGDNNNLMPNQSCTRGQIVTMLYRMLGK